jgi:RimJ/RimL family protein N-acetyltransferase
MALFHEEFDLKNGMKLTIRNPEPDDATGIIEMMNIVDTETTFLAREPGEFDYTEERERELIAGWKEDENTLFLVAVIDGKLVGSCNANIKPRARCRHRSMIGISILKEFWGIGIGRRMMESCISWSRSKNVTKIELEVNTENARAIALYESLGFVKQGLLKHQWRMTDGSYRDGYMMAIFYD